MPVQAVQSNTNQPKQSSYLRAGVLGREEAVEPMSAWKWSRVYGLAMVHGLEAETWAGIELLKGQFFMRLPDALRQQWEQSAANARPAPRTPLTPRLAKKLDRLEDEADRPADATLSVLRSMVTVSQSLLTADRWVRQLLSLATLLSPPTTHHTPPRIDREQHCPNQNRKGKSKQNRLLPFLHCSIRD